MYSDREIEQWYLGIPFDAPVEDIGREKPERQALKVRTVNDDDVERLFLGLPLIAA